MQQTRLVLALLISTVILIGWYYLFPIKPSQNSNQNQSNVSNTSASPSPRAGQAATTAPSPAQTSSSPPVQTVRQRNVVIKTPLYDAKFDTQGAVATSWILKANKDNGKKLSSAGGDKLELISQEGLKHQPREAPFDLVTGDV